jgi:hypothetical protein
MGPVLRASVLAVRLLPVAGAVALLTACGSPPEPLPTGPPEVYGTGPAPSGPAGAFPSGGVPSIPLPTNGGLPTGGYPTYAPPTYPTYPAPTTSPPRPTGPPPAPKCTKGPTAAQVIAVVKATGSLPDGAKPEVKDGPRCAGTWQFTVIGEVGKTLDQVDPLLAVTTGKPTALKVEEVGADVCSDHVAAAAPPGIRVLACGT